jgi:hypothetical protein
MENLLKFLDGRKAVILSICAAILSYLVAGGIIDANLGALIQTILSILAGGAVIMTDKTLGKRNFEGKRVKNI